MAHGHAITKTAILRINAGVKSLMIIQLTTNVTKAIPITTGTKIALSYLLIAEQVVYLPVPVLPG